MKITTLTANPCIDRTLVVEEIRRGKSHRVQKTLLDFSGKGINVALAASALGAEVTAICLAHEDGAAKRFFRENPALTPVLVPTVGNARINTKLFESGSGQMTELNETGEVVGEEQVIGLRQAVQDALPQTDILVLAGSVPPGVSPVFYKQLGLLAKQKGVPFLLDASGELLRQGMEAVPTLIKPNAEEYEATFGVTPKPTESFCKECRQMLDRYDIPYAIVSMGEAGALLIGPYDAWYSEPVHIDVKGVQGAGDSMVAGIAWAIANGRSLGGELLRVAVACAHASLELPGTQMCDAVGMEKRLDAVPLYQIDRWIPRR